MESMGSFICLNICLDHMDKFPLLWGRKIIQQLIKNIGMNSRHMIYLILEQFISRYVQRIGNL